MIGALIKRHITTSHISLVRVVDSRCSRGTAKKNTLALKTGSRRLSPRTTDGTRSRGRETCESGQNEPLEILITRKGTNPSERVEPATIRLPLDGKMPVNFGRTPEPRRPRHEAGCFTASDSLGRVISRTRLSTSDRCFVTSQIQQLTWYRQRSHTSGHQTQNNL